MWWECVEAAVWPERRQSVREIDGRQVIEALDEGVHQEVGGILIADTAHWIAAIGAWFGQ